MTDDDKPKKEKPAENEGDRPRETPVQELDKNQAVKEVTPAAATVAGQEDERTRGKSFDSSVAGKQFGKVEVAGSDGALPVPGEAPKPVTELQKQTLSKLIALRMRRGDGEPLGNDTVNAELGKPKDNKNVWKEFRIRDQASPDAAAVLPDSGNKLVIGRSNDADFRLSHDGSVSRRNSEIEMRPDGQYIRDLGSTYGTTIERNGKLITVPKPTADNPNPEAVKLQPGDVIRLGEYGGTRLSWEKPGAPAEKWKPAGYQTEKVRDGATQEERDAADPATSKKAREASNEYLRNHEYSGRMPDGFQIVGGMNQIDEKGQHNDKDRPSYVIDTRPGKDPALEKFIADAQRDLAHLKDKPEELAKELARRAKETLEPKGWTDREITDGYMKLRAEHAGGRLMLGDFITAAQKGEGAGVCNHQSALTKVAFDSFYPDDATRPKMTLVKGFYGSNPAGVSPADALNHAWTTLEVNGKQMIFDPRGQIYGGNRDVYLNHHPGSEVPQLRPADGPALAADKVGPDRLVGKEAGFGGQVWRIKEIKDGQAVLVADLSRVTSLKNLQTNNTGPDGQPRELRVGDTYKIKRTSGGGEVTDGWVLQGWADPTKKDLAVMVKKDGVERSVPLDQLREQNAHLFRGDAPAADKPPGGRDNPPSAPDRPVGKNPVEYGLVEGREVKHDRRNWYVAGYDKDGRVELHSPGNRQLDAEEYREYNGDRKPNVGDDVWVKRSSGAMEKWRVTAIDPETGKVSTRSESAFKETVPLDKLLKQNPDIERQHSTADVRRILSDPRSKVEIICPWTDAKNGHDVFIGKVTGANGENIKVMIHKPPGFGGDWERARNDMAAQAVARGMGKGEQFPATAFRDGMMVQAFVGREGENLHSYLHNQSRQDPELRRAYPDLEKRIEKMMETIDPKLRTELARGVAFSALLGDGDQHGNNFVIERTGPNPGDVRVARIDTDYAFNKNKTPVIDRQGNYGGVVNGLFAHFSGKELPAEVRAEIKQLSDRLNPADPAARKAAREQFAREAAVPGVKPLTAEQVDALAQRAKFMAETGHFPESKPVRRSTDSVQMVGRTREPVEGDILVGTVKSAPAFDHNAAIESLKPKLAPGQAEQLREAFEKKVPGMSDKDAADMQAKLKQLADSGSKSSAAEVKAWADVLVVKANHPELPIDVARINGMKPNEVVDFAKFVKNVDKLDAIPKDVIAQGTVAKLKENLIAAASNPENAGRIGEFNKIIDKLSDANFARQYGDQRAQHLGKLLEAQDRNALLNIPFEQLLDKDLHVDAMKFAADRFNEASRGFKVPVMTGDPAKDTGARVEFNASVAAMKASKGVQPDGSRLIFIPSAHGAAADGFGIDGAILDLKTGKINPVDWTSNMSTKDGDKGLWANEPPRTLIDRGKIDPEHTTGSSADMLKLLREHARTKPGVTTDELKAANMTQAFPKFGADSNPVRQAEDIISGIKSFNRAFDAKNPSNLLLQKMNDRAMNSTATYDAVRNMANRLGTSIANDLYTEGRFPRPANANLDASALATTLKPQTDMARRTPAGKPMQYVELNLQQSYGIETAVGTRGIRRDSAEINTVRLYEDGSVVGIRNFSNSKGPQTEQVELGHLRNFKHAIANPFGSTDPRHDQFDRTVDTMLNGVSAQNPIDFTKPNEVVRHLAQATERNQVLQMAADRTRSIDTVKRNASDLSEEEIDRVASSGKVPKGNFSADAYRRAAAELAAQDRFPTGSATDKQIADMADKSLALQKSNVPKEVARDAAALAVMHNMPDKDAIRLAQVMAEVRGNTKGVSFDRAMQLASGELSLANVTKNGTADVQAVLKDLIAKAKPGNELQSVYEGLLKHAEGEALKDANPKTGAWSDLHQLLDSKDGQDKLAKMLGISPGTNPGDIAARLKEAVDNFGAVGKAEPDLVKERVETAPTTVASAADLKVSSELLNEKRVGEFHEYLKEKFGDIKGSTPEEAGPRLKKAMIDFMEQSGMKPDAFKKMEFAFDKSATAASITYTAGEGDKAQKVVRRGGDFVTEGGQKVNPADVTTKVVLPDTLRTGNVGELTRAVWSAALEQTNAGQHNAGEMRGIHQWVTTALKSHAELPAGEPVFRAQAGSGVEVAQLPPTARPTEKIAITESGVRMPGGDKEISFAEVWSKHLEQLKEELKAEEKKTGAERKEARIRELQKQVTDETQFHARLAKGETKALEEARTRLSDFKVSDRDIDRLAGEHGGANVRGRLVALTILASAFLAHQQKAAAKEAKDKAEKSGATGGEPMAEPGGAPPQGRQKGSHEDVPGAKEVTPVRDASDKPAEAKNLDKIPNWTITRDAMLRAIAPTNGAIEAQNAAAKAKDDKAPQQELISREKLEAEWARGEFGPESRRAWQTMKQHIERDSTQLMQQLDARGLPWPPGAPAGPKKSESGSGLPETDEMFRSRVRSGDVTVDLKLRDLKPGEVPNAQEVASFVNAVAWTGFAGIAYSKAYIEGQANYIDKSIDGMKDLSKSGNLDGWKKPTDASLDAMDRWSAAALPWMATVLRAKNYAETVAAYNAATTTHGADWPGLATMFKSAYGAGSDKTVFPDDALRAFPGEIKRRADGSIESMKMDLPTSLDRTPENLAKIKRIEDWIEKWGPQVDQVSNELLKIATTNPERILIHAEDGDFDRTKTLTGNEALQFKRDNPNAAVGQPVKVGDEPDWRLKAINPDGTYSIEKATPKDGKPFNLIRYGVTTEACDKDGKPTASGDYIKMAANKDYMWSPWYSYNNWNWTGTRSVERVDTMKPQVFHKNDFVAVMDNGRVRLMQAKNVQAWYDAQEATKQTGNVVNVLVDVGMIATGTMELKAAGLAWSAAKKGGEVAMKDFAKHYIEKELIKGVWHIGLGATGLAKQAIENHVPFGREIIKARHYAIMADLTLQLTPGAFQKGLSAGIFGKGASAMDFYTARAVADMSKFDKALMGIHKVYEGGKVLGVKNVGLFMFADASMIAQFGDTLNALKSDNQREKLVAAMLKHRQGDLPGPATSTDTKGVSVESLKRATQLTLGEYTRNISAADKDAPNRAEDIIKAVKQASELKRDDKGRQECVQRLLEIYNGGRTPAEKLAAAKGLVELCKDGTRLPLVMGTVDGANGRKVRITATEVSDFVARGPAAIEKLNGSGQALLKQAGEAMFVPENDPKRIEFAKQAGDLFRNKDASEQDRLAAAIALMSLKQGDNLAERLGAPNGPKAEDVIAYLKDRVANSPDHGLRMVAGDTLARANRSSTLTYEAQQQAVDAAQKKATANKDDEAAGKELVAAKEKLEDMRKYLRTIDFNEGSMANLCMDIVKNPNASRQAKLDAIASPMGLAAIYDHYRNELEPSLMREQDGGKRINGLASLYGRDSAAIEKVLRGVAGDGAQDADVRAVAARALAAARGERNSVNEVPLSPNITYSLGTAGNIKVNGEGIEANHATIIQRKDGQIQIRDNGSKGGTTIIHSDGKREKVGGDYVSLKAGDRVVMGPKDTELFFGHERLTAVGTLAADVRQKSDKPGQISQAYLDQVKADLEKPITATSPVERTEAFVAKHRAALAAVDLGPSITGGDAKKHAELVAEALAATVQANQPEVAAASLAQLTPDRIAALSVKSADALRERTLSTLADSPTSEADIALRQAMIAKIPDIFANGTPQQKSRAQNVLESLLIPGASADLAKQDKGMVYPRQSQSPEVRMAALEMLTKLNPDRGAEIAKLLLIGGDYNGRKIEPDIARVRAVAVTALDSAKPFDLQATALQALQKETDPAVLQRLWNSEYGARRPENDPVRALEEYRELEAKVLKRSEQNILGDGEKKYREVLKAERTEVFTHLAWQARGYINPYDRSAAPDYNHPEAKRARQALLYAAASQEGKFDDLASRVLIDLCREKGKELAPEFAIGLEHALLHNPRMGAEARAYLVAAYRMMKPGENGIVTKDEAAVVLLRVLQNHPATMGDNRWEDTQRHVGSEKLFGTVLAGLKEMKSEKAIPILEALAGKEPVQGIDEQGRPTVVKYGDTTRRFKWDDKTGELASFTELPSGKVFDAVPGKRGVFRTKGGEEMQGVGAVTRPAEPVTDDTYQLNFRRLLVNGDYGDFRYMKDGKSVIEKPNGMVITEELGNNSRKVTYQYPDGKGTREFLWTGDERKKINLTVTGPDGKKDNWTWDMQDYGRWLSGKHEGADGRLLTMFKNSWDKTQFDGAAAAQLDFGDYVYVAGRKLHHYDSKGNKLVMSPDGSREPATRAPGAEIPYTAVRVFARQLLNDLREGGTPARQKAQAELDYINTQQAKDPAFKSDYGSKATAQQIAGAMGGVLGDSTKDGQAVTKALYQGMLSKPLEGETDPRLNVLRMGIKDKNELVRVTAASFLAQSTSSADRQMAAFALADIGKNSPSTGLRTEAGAALELLKKTEPQLVERALAETPLAPRNEVGDRPTGDPATRDIRYQRVFEDLRRGLLDGRQEAAVWDWQDWREFQTKYGLDMLGSGGLSGAERKAADQVDKNRGSFDDFVSREKTKEAERQVARDAQLPKMWAQFDSLVRDYAMNKGDLDPAGRAARQALVYTIMSNGREFRREHAATAVQKAVDGIHAICTGNGPGRGDMEWALRSLLTEKQDLSAEHKMKLVESLDALTGNKGKISRETTSTIAMVALEQEMRFMPSAGQPGHEQSLEYQKKLLDLLSKHGNADLGPAMGLIAKAHTDQGVREKAAQVQKTILESASAGVKRLVSQMVEDTAGTRKFAGIRDERDPRIAPLVAAMNDSNRPAEQRFRAAEILIAPENRGVKDADRKAAAAAYADLSLKLPQPQKQFEAALRISDHTNQQFNDQQRSAAASVLAKLSVQGPAEIRERAGVEVEKLKGAEATTAIKEILSECSKLKPSDETKQLVTASLERIATLYSQSPKDKDAQALLWQAAQSSEVWLGADHAASKKLVDLIKAGPQTNLTDDKDPRLPFMITALIGSNNELKLNAVDTILNSPDFKDKPKRDAAMEALNAVATSGDAEYAKRALDIAVNLADEKRKDVPKETADDARKIIYWRLDSMIEDARKLESGPDKTKAAAGWKGIEDVLTRIGEKENDYGRTYVAMKRLEAEGGKDNKLVPLYKRLAEISEQRGAKEAAELFKQKADRAERGTADGGTAFKAADANFAEAKRLAATATTPGQIADAERKLKDSVAAYKTAAGPKSVQAADALTELAKYYASQGKTDEARAASKEAIAIFEGEGAARHPITTRQKAFALGTLATSTYGVPGQENENKQAMRKLAAADDAGIDRKNPATQQILTDLVDYMLSKGAIKDDTMKDAEALLQRAAEARVATFGKDSVEAGQGSERLADFYLQTGQAEKAIGEYRAAAKKYEGNPAMTRQFGAAQTKLAQSLSWTGDYRGAHAAMEKGIATMAQPGSTVSPLEVEMQVRQYQQMLVNHGQPGAAEQWEKRLKDYKTTGVLDTRPTGQVQTQWPPSPGMGNGPAGGNGPGNGDS